MGGPSSEGYTAVPTEPIDEHVGRTEESGKPTVEPVVERIDDGVEAQDDADASDDEGLYNTSAPLLSQRTRGNDTPCPHRRGRMDKFVALFRRPAWTKATRSKRQWATISIMGFIGLLLTTVVALSISTGVLAQRPSSCPSNYRRWQPKTHIPLNEAWQSANDRLNFAQVYPSLSKDASEACKTAWNSLRYVPCHEKIWNRSWDNGKHESLFELDPSQYSGPMCITRCTDSISQAAWLLSSQCTHEDTFDMENYIGPFLADPKLEDGPLAVVETIVRRLQHTCRKNPATRSYYYSADYCVNHLYNDWFIIDGVNAGNLEGLDLFETATSQARTERYRRYRYNPDKECDDTWQDQPNLRFPRRFGPGTNQTDCGWCTLNWFDRKLKSWKEGKVLDPKNGTAVALPDYLQRIRHVGQRCEADDWNRIYNSAIRKYKASGELPIDWKDDGWDMPLKPCKKVGTPLDGTPLAPAKHFRPSKPVNPVKPVKPLKPVEPVRPATPPKKVVNIIEEPVEVSELL